MAPRRARVKAGLTRMDAALDAMRPMGFNSGVVRTCVNKLLKVYGNDGWAFIEEAAYKLLIDTILEEPEDPQLKYPSEQLLEDGSHGDHQPPVPVGVEHQLCGEDVICQEQVRTLEICQAKVNVEDTYLKKEEKQELELVIGIKVETETNQEQESPAPLQVEAKVCLPSMDAIPTNPRCRPCYGWISEDEDEDEDMEHDFMRLTPAKR